MKNKEKLRTTIPVRLTDSMLSSVKTAAEKLNLSEQDTFRFLSAVGLVCLQKSGYDLPAQIADKALKI